MKTLICVTPGVLEYENSDMPVLTKGNAILKIRRIGVCGTDLHAFEGTQPYFQYPRILGHEIAAELVSVDELPDFRIGEAVSFLPYLNCGECLACTMGKPNCCSRLQVCGVHTDGAMAAYFSIPSANLVHGQGLSFDELALIEPLAIGAHGIRRAGVQAGEYVLVIGAGPIGLGTMEFARIAGAQVIAMDINEKRLAFCREKLHVPYSINAGSPEAEEQIKTITNGNMPSVVIDATGNQKAINNAFRYMSHGARFVLIGLQRGDISFSHPEFHKREATLMSSRNATRQDFDQVIEAMKSGQINPTTYITHRVNFDEVKDKFKSWLDPSSEVIKAMISIDGF